MRTITQRCLSVLMVCAVVGAGAFGAVNLDRAPEPVSDHAPVGEANAIACGGGCIVVGGTLAAAGGAYAYKKLFAEPAMEEIQETEAKETHRNVYAATATLKQNQDILFDSMDNYLSDTASIARMEGKNAYIRALNNGSTKSEAVAASHQAINEYYAVKQHQLWSLWETTHDRYTSLHEDVATTANLSTGDVFINTGGDYPGDNGNYADQYATYNGEDGTVETTSKTLLNGSTREVTLMEYGLGTTSPFTVEDVPVRYGAGPVSSSLDQVRFIDERWYANTWDQIETQAANVQQNLTTFADNTYTEYQQGEIDNSDLVDPYLGARDYSPNGSYGTWGVRSATAMGLSAPVDVGETKWMTVTAGENTYEGILLTDDTPTGGFEIGTTYNATNLAGPQLMQTKDGTVEFGGSFTIQNITRTDGTKQTSGTVEYRDPGYQTTSIEEYEERMDTIRNLTAQLNARQNRLTNTSGGSGGGGALFPDELPFGGWGVGGAIAAFLALMTLGVVRG